MSESEDWLNVKEYASGTGAVRSSGGGPERGYGTESAMIEGSEGTVILDFNVKCAWDTASWHKPCKGILGCCARWKGKHDRPDFRSIYLTRVSFPLCQRIG